MELSSAVHRQKKTTMSFREVSESINYKVPALTHFHFHGVAFGVITTERHTLKCDGRICNSFHTSCSRTACELNPRMDNTHILSEIKSYVPTTRGYI